MNKIICGNALTELKKIENDSIDLVITSPPYWEQRKYIKDKECPSELGTEKLMIDYESKLGAIFGECVRVCKPTGNIVFNLGDKYVQGCLQLIPYRFAIRAIDYNEVMLVNDITWVKTNPTPRQYKKRLISSTEPFFHFAKTKNYYYNPDVYLKDEKNRPRKKITSKKGKKYKELIEKSNLTDLETTKARVGLLMAFTELEEGKITDFRMKIRGIHKEAFGGQSGGRNSQIRNNGFTIIKMFGNKLKRDVIENSVANTKNIDHPAVFPLKVIIEMVKLLSKENSIVLDPFCGSGQVCLASKSLNRNYLGIDLNKKYCELAQERIDELSKIESKI